MGNEVLAKFLYGFRLFENDSELFDLEVYSEIKLPSLNWFNSD